MNDFYEFDCDLLALLHTYRGAAEYAQFEDVAAQFLTLNCGDSVPSAQLKSLIVSGKDLYVISLQEIDTDAQVFVTSTSKLSAQYLTLFASVIPHQFRYQQMGSQMLAVFVSDRLPVKSVEFFPVATGNLGIPNKGGIVCKLHVADSIFGVLGCHLNASRDSSGVGKRNSSLARILTHSSIKTERTLQVQLAQQAGSRSALPDEASLLGHLPATLQDCEWFVVLGDLNYRVSSGLSAAEAAHRLVSDEDFQKEFLAGDELLQQMNYFRGKSVYPGFQCANSAASSECEASDAECLQSGVGVLSEAGNAGIQQSKTAVCGAFAYFRELPIAFLPTYCYCKKSNTYQTAEPKIRMPAFTDRVLWMQCDALSSFSAMQYARMEYDESDHRPVSLQASFKTRTIDAAARNECYERERAALLRQRAKLCPSFEIDATSVRLELVFNSSATLTIAVRNAHATQEIRLSVQIPCRHAVQRTIDVRVPPLSSKSLELAFRMDFFEAADREQLDQMLQTRDFKIIFRHAHGGQILQQREVDVECRLVGADPFMRAISTDTSFGPAYKRLYAAKEGGGMAILINSGNAQNSSLSDLQILCGVIKFNHSAELAAVERLYRENSVASSQRRSFAAFLLDSLGLVARNQVVCLFTLVKGTAAAARDAVAKFMQPFGVVLLFVFDALQNV